jgi:hypothetical protein
MTFIKIEHMEPMKRTTVQFQTPLPPLMTLYLFKGIGFRQGLVDREDVVRDVQLEADAQDLVDPVHGPVAVRKGRPCEQVEQERELAKSPKKGQGSG